MTKSHRLFLSKDVVKFYNFRLCLSDFNLVRSAKLHKQRFC